MSWTRGGGDYSVCGGRCLAAQLLRRQVLCPKCGSDDWDHPEGAVEEAYCMCCGGRVQRIAIPTTGVLFPAILVLEEARAVDVEKEFAV